MKIRSLSVLLAMACAMPVAAQGIKIGDLGIVADAPFYIAMEKGFFTAEKLQVSLEPFGSAADTTVQLSTNRLQVVGGGASAGLFNAFARDWPIRIAMARTRDMPGYSSDTLILREDLVGVVKTVADLKGRTIAINAPAGSLHYMVGKMMESAGLNIDDVKIVYMSWPDMGTASATKAIDAGTVVEPFAAQYSERKLAQPFKRAADILRDPPLEVSVMLFSREWINKSPGEAAAFTLAYLKAARIYYDAMKGGPSRAEVVDILTRYTRLKDKTMYDRIQWSYMDPNAEISIAGLQDQASWYRKQGTLDRDVDVRAMIDRRFLDTALATLGRVAEK
jgi:NitT/TauT family transport system substrate-binding protein